MFKKSKKHSDNKPSAKYHSFDTFPAKAFFDVRDSSPRNYQLMRPRPSTPTETLEKIFNDVYDEFFVKMDNENGKRFIALRGKIAIVNYKKQTVSNILKFIWETPESLWNVPEVIEMRREQITALNEKYLDTPIDLENDFLDELDRVLNVELGIMDNDLFLLTHEMEELTKDHKETIYNYYAELQILEDAHGRTLDEKMMLPKFVESTKSAIKKGEAYNLRQQQNGGK